jgi:hypothetical protein
MSVIRILTDRGREYCGKPETYDYQLYLALNDIEHTKTKAFHPQTRTHQGRVCCGRTPMQTMIDGKEAYNEKVKALNKLTAALSEKRRLSDQIGTTTTKFGIY